MAPLALRKSSEVGRLRVTATGKALSQPHRELVAGRRSWGSWTGRHEDAAPALP